MKPPHKLTHQVYALAVVYLYRLPLDSLGEMKGCGWKQPLASAWVHAEEMENPVQRAFRCPPSVSFAGPRNSAAALSLLLNPVLDDVTAAKAGLPRASTVRDSKRKATYKITMYCQLNYLRRVSVS